MRPVNLRVAGLGTAVAVAVLLPIVAVAGDGETSGARPAGTGTSGARAGAEALAGGAETGDRQAGGTEAGGPEAEDGRPGGGAGAGGTGPLTGLGLGPGTRTPSVPPESASRTPALASDPVMTAPERTTACGPELASPEGIEAQTCVLAEGHDTWARTYYRNATGQELDAYLTLMTPGGKTVQVRCRVMAQDEPGSCETPRERGRGAATAYTAVAEFAGAGEGGHTPLLLRSGSNTADAEGS